MKLNITKKAMLSVLTATLMLSSVSATALPLPKSIGIPKTVYDPFAMEQTLLQLQAMKSQIEALTGKSNYADLLNNPLIRKELNRYLPKGYRDIFQAAQRNDLGALNQVLQQAIAEEQKAQTRQSGVARAAATRLLTKASLDSMMDNLSVESGHLDSMVSQINKTKSLAQKQDLMNAIGAKQAQLNLKMGQMQIMMKQAEWQQKQADRQAIRDFHKKFNK